MLSTRTLVTSSLASLLVRLCSADVGFSSPAAGATISGTTIDVVFADGAGSPSINDFTTYTLQLCAGGNTEDEYTILYTFTDKGDFSTDGADYTAQIKNTALGGSTKNAYFLRTIGAAPGGVVYNFSPRFTLSAMTGTFPANIQTALSSISGTAGPETINNIADPQNAAAGAGAAAPAGAFGIAYTLQTGPIRYAPMAKIAPSKITAKGNARAYPTSGYNIFSRSGMPPPDATQTVTDPQTFAVSMMEPTIVAQAAPQARLGKRDDMEMFLERWKD